ncbi:MAG: hypothetical protein ACYSUT_01530 [Planctomycetota bacterium]|jgi:hypothetical protein
MTLAGWIFMITSWTIILGLFAFCLKRTLGGSPNRNDSEQGQPEEQSLS